MLYTDFIQKTMDLTIEQADNGLYYLEPLWRNILNDNQINITDISDAKVDWSSIFDVLELEVKKRNTINSAEPYVLEWIFSVIMAQTDSEILTEETELIKKAIELRNNEKENVQ